MTRFALHALQGWALRRALLSYAADLASDVFVWFRFLPSTAELTVAGVSLLDDTGSFFTRPVEWAELLLWAFCWLGVLGASLDIIVAAAILVSLVWSSHSWIYKSRLQNLCKIFWKGAQKRT